MLETALPSTATLAAIYSFVRESLSERCRAQRFTLCVSNRRSMTIGLTAQINRRLAATTPKRIPSCAARRCTTCNSCRRPCSPYASIAMS